MSTTHKFSVGDRVRIKKTLNYDGRVGVLRSNSGDPEDIWDFNVDLEAVEPAEGASRSEVKLSEARTIGVDESQIEHL